MQPAACRRCCGFDPSAYRVRRFFNGNFAGRPLRFVPSGNSRQRRRAAAGTGLGDAYVAKAVASHRTQKMVSAMFTIVEAVSVLCAGSGGIRPRLKPRPANRAGGREARRYKGNCSPCGSGLRFARSCKASARGRADCPLGRRTCGSRGVRWRVRFSGRTTAGHRCSPWQPVGSDATARWGRARRTCSVGVVRGCGVLEADAGGRRWSPAVGGMPPHSARTVAAVELVGIRAKLYSVR